jgi:hypothetical protein
MRTTVESGRACEPRPEASRLLGRARDLVWRGCARQRTRCPRVGANGPAHLVAAGLSSNRVGRRSAVYGWLAGGGDRLLAVRANAVRSASSRISYSVGLSVKSPMASQHSPSLRTRSTCASSLSREGVCRSRLSSLRSSRPIRRRSLVRPNAFKVNAPPVFQERQATVRQKCWPDRPEACAPQRSPAPL